MFIVSASANKEHWLMQNGLFSFYEKTFLCVTWMIKHSTGIHCFNVLMLC